MNALQVQVSRPVSSFNPVARISLQGDTIRGVMPPPPPRNIVQVSRVGMGNIPINGASGQVSRIQISDSAPDADTIITAIYRLGEQFAQNPYVRQVALAIVGPTTNNNLQFQVSQLVNFVKRNVTYVRDPAFAEWLTSPVSMLQQIGQGQRAQGDCDDHVLLLNSLLGAMGIEAIPVAVKLNGAAVFNHVISTVAYNGKQFDVDPCAKGVPQPVYRDKLLPQQ